MNSVITSFNNMFNLEDPEVPRVNRIEIPIIQRDYAQGRNGAKVERIRSKFLDVLFNAAIGGEKVSLDFIYGNVDEAGTLWPLDGQQRLTTLFLLHWYLAFRLGKVCEDMGWKAFTYATRASARLFCERLVSCQPPTDTDHISEWIQDQPESVRLGRYQ